MMSRKGPRRSLSERLDMLAAGVPPEMIDPRPDLSPDEEDDLDDDSYLTYDDYLDRDIELHGPMVDNTPLGTVNECVRSIGALIAENETLWDLNEGGSAGGWPRPSLRPRDIRGITPELVTVFVLLVGPVARPIWKVLAWMMLVPPNPEEFFLGCAGRGRPADISRKVMVWFYDGRDLEEDRPKSAPHALAKRVTEIFASEKQLSRQNIRTWREQPNYDNSVRAIYRLLRALRTGGELKVAQMLMERTASLRSWQK